MCNGNEIYLLQYQLVWGLQDLYWILDTISVDISREHETPRSRGSRDRPYLYLPRYFQSVVSQGRKDISSHRNHLISQNNTDHSFSPSIEDFKTDYDLAEVSQNCFHMNCLLE